MMKRLLLFLLASSACFGGEMVQMVDRDFKIPDGEKLKVLVGMRPQLDMKNADDRKVLEYLNQAVYGKAMMEIAAPFFRQTRLKGGDDWRKFWAARQKAALDEIVADEVAHDYLRKALAKLKEFEGGDEALVLEQAVKAKFGGAQAWILMVRSEREDVVKKATESGVEATMGHFVVIGVRGYDQATVAIAMDELKAGR